MKITFADHCSLFREKVCNKQVSGAMHVTGWLALIGAFHG